LIFPILHKNGYKFNRMQNDTTQPWLKNAALLRRVALTKYFLQKKASRYYFWGLFAFALLVSACNTQLPLPPSQTTPTIPSTASPTGTSNPTLVPARVLSICLGQEPQSLFIYGDQSLAARSVLEAIYDGPFDLLNFEPKPVILEKLPSLADGDAKLEPAQVNPGEWVVDTNGKLASLGDGVSYLPSGCKDAACAQTYSGKEPVAIDQLVVRFKLKAGLQWSDGTPLTAQDSQYSFELAKALFPRFRPDLINHTFSYQALDETTTEWRGIPGYLDTQYAINFFSPLPRHAWEIYPPEQLLTQELSTRKPLGWGPYVIDEWIAGDHITFHKNPRYFRAAEGLPAFDRLVYRFVSSGEEALSALEAGECDLVDKTALSEKDNAALEQLSSARRLAVAYENGSAWEHIDFGIQPSSQEKTSLFQSKEMRQAIARCIDRESIATSLFPGQSQTLDSYVPPIHPLYNPGVTKYNFDPQVASSALEALGWIDDDNKPQTPRIAQGVSGIPDGTPLQITYQTINGEIRKQAAEMVKESLAKCGVGLNIVLMDWDKLFAPGPEGPLFGRQFEMAQFGWETSLEPACFLYTSDEIPGPYPGAPKGWGGANASGYSNSDFDAACKKALNTLPDQPEHADAHRQAQAIFASDLPVIPLYLIPTHVAMRIDMCGVMLDPSASSALWNLEAFNYGAACQAQK
jgi:peptide/nickel transport system substrate-binding protein